jgi:hypothetical protein
MFDDQVHYALVMGKYIILWQVGPSWGWATLVWKVRIPVCPLPIMTHSMSFLCSDELEIRCKLLISCPLHCAWTACMITPENLVPCLLSQLRKIDFDQIKRDFPEGTKVSPKGWSKFLHWIYRHNHQSQWFPRIYNVRFIGKPTTLAANESKSKIDQDKGEEWTCVEMLYYCICSWSSIQLADGLIIHAAAYVAQYTRQPNPA